jgi:hypothetical protein
MAFLQVEEATGPAVERMVAQAAPSLGIRRSCDPDAAPGATQVLNHLARLFSAPDTVCLCL